MASTRYLAACLEGQDVVNAIQVGDKINKITITAMNAPSVACLQHEGRLERFDSWWLGMSSFGQLFHRWRARRFAPDRALKNQ